MFEALVEHIKKSQKIILTTHKQCDGDGLGAQLGMYHALKSVGKNVRVLNVDSTPHKYRFLKPEEFIQYYDGQFDPITDSDLTLVFDTNDKRLLMPLYPDLEKHSKNIFFIDHHPVLKSGPGPTPGSYINTSAASTGEIAYDLITALKIPLNEEIARAIYTSIAFDTQLFRYVRDSGRSHEIAADLLKYEKHPTLVHKHLFGNFTATKLKYLSKVLSEMEFFHDERLAFLHIKTDDLLKMGLLLDDSRDLVDMMMNIETVEVATLIREDQKDTFKVSLRSKGNVPVNQLAELLDGGGHVFSAGASVNIPAEQLKKKIIDHFK